MMASPIQLLLVACSETPRKPALSYLATRTTTRWHAKASNGDCFPIPDNFWLAFSMIQQSGFYTSPTPPIYSTGIKSNVVYTGLAYVNTYLQCMLPGGVGYTRLPPDKFSLLQLQFLAVEGEVCKTKFIFTIVEGEETFCTLYIVLKLHGVKVGTEHGLHHIRQGYTILLWNTL